MFELTNYLFNDYSNVNDMIKKSIEVAELLYENKDTLLDYKSSKEKIKSA